MLTVAVLAALGGLAGCGKKPDVAVSKITIVGSSTIAPLMSEIAKAFEKSNPGVRIDVQSGGTSRGVLDVRQGTAQIGMVSRELKADEKLDLRRVLLAKDGLAMIVHKSNPVKALTKQQVVDIYSGKLTNWRDAGGPDLPITVVSKAEGRSTLEVFSQYFGLSYKNIKAHVVIGDNHKASRLCRGRQQGSVTCRSEPPSTKLAMAPPFASCHSTTTCPAPPLWPRATIR